ncbi:MAG: hypothetical protein IT546_08255 [Caulobacteraceae bacterium]|nr:hypothetical protein [Caulobacteraceae bacterium]
MALQTFVHEVVINTYDRNSTYEIAAADACWTATKGYWAAVRQAWDAAIAEVRTLIGGPARTRPLAALK